MTPTTTDDLPADGRMGAMMMLKMGIAPDDADRAAHTRYFRDPTQIRAAYRTIDAARKAGR